MTEPGFTSGVRLDDSTTTLVTARKLPIVVSPVPDETVESYLHRLELANHLRRDILAKRFQRDQNWIDRLAKLTGRTRDRLAHALPEVAHAPHHLNSSALNNHLERPRRARPCCQRCAAAKHASGQVASWLPVARRVCIRHRIWIDWITWSRTPNVDISALPDVVHAQRRLDRLIRRYPPTAINKAFDDAEDVVRYWSERESWGEELRQDRYNNLWGPAEWRWSVGRANVGMDIANFPEIVTLTGMFLSSVWRGVAALSDRYAWADNAFVTEAGHRLAIPQFTPGGSRDHLLNWIDDRRQEYRRYTRARPLLLDDHEAIAELDWYYNPLRPDWWTEPELLKGSVPAYRRTPVGRARYVYYEGSLPK